MISLRDRWSTSAVLRHETHPHASTVDRVLYSLGAEPEFAEALLGDLAEELALRTERDGLVAARLWYIGEATRSVPHVVRSVLLHARPTRLAAYGAAVALPLAFMLAAVLNRDGPPARLVVDGGHTADGVVVNSARATQLPVQVLDAAGHRLPSNDVRFSWESGAPLAVSDHGVVSCRTRSDATVRVSVGDVAERVAVRCRPVRLLSASTTMSLIAGSPGRELPLAAIGDDGRVVHELRGTASVIDSSVAAIVDSRVRPRGVGATTVAIVVGDKTTRVRVAVHELVHAFTGLRWNQRFVAVRVRLQRGQTARWTLPEGGFLLQYIPRREGDAPPTITVHGPMACIDLASLDANHLPADEHGISCNVRGPGATVTVSHGAAGAAIVDGALALDRQLEPSREP